MQKVYTKIESIVGNVVTVRATDVRLGDLALVGDSYATVIKLDKDLVSLQVFAGAQGVGTSDPVRFLGRPMMVSFSDHLLGRVFDGAGVPRDHGPALTENMIPIGGPSFNPAKRILPKNMIRTGIPMIDVFNTLVESQKLPIFSISGEPYNALLSRIALQAEVDVIVLGGMGLKYDDYLAFRDTLEKGGAMSHTVMFIHTASDPTVECTLVPDMALAVAEQFALNGKKVLVLLTDMTNYADAQKEMAITMEQVPSNRGYPGDLYSCLASRYEKAVDIEGAGSITILGVTTMPGDDVTHPVPDNTGYITEGQYYLKNGHIEPFGSLSRLKQNVNGKTRDDHRALMDGMIRLYSQYKEALEKKSMGFLMSDWDEKLLKYGELFETKLMDLSVNIPLEDALDLGWEILAECFEPNETGLKTSLLQERWPNKEALHSKEQLMAIKLTKNEQKLQKDRLKQYQRYLPTLQLKKQQLQAVITKTKADLEQKEVERAQMIGDLDDWVAVFAENEIFAESKKLDHLVQPDTVICKNENIAGVTVPAFQELTFKDIAYDVDDYPLWVDTAIIKLREIARLDALVSTLRKQEALLEKELRSTSQRVNLFEKVKIPEAKENIRIIGVFLGDQQTAAVVRGKISKKKLTEAAQ